MNTINNNRELVNIDNLTRMRRMIRSREPVRGVENTQKKKSYVLSSMKIFSISNGSRYGGTEVQGTNTK